MQGQFENLTDRSGLYTPVPVLMWTDGVPVEMEAMKQLANLSTLPFIHDHIAVMPDVHFGMGATVGSVIATKGAIVPAAVGVDIGCFVGDTKVPLLDGTQATLEVLSKRQEPFWVYSLNAVGKIAPGKARALRTRTNAQLMRVVVSGGDEIICTPDHHFMLNDGSYRAASDLSFNDSLMPLYRRWQTRDGYESVSTGKGSSAQTHILVWEALNGPVPDGHVVHHESHIHFDNRPDNLTLMTVSEHSAHHRRIGHSFDNADPSFQERRLAGVARRASDPVARQKMVEVGTANIQLYMADRPQHFSASVAQNGERGAPYLRTFNTSPRKCDDCGLTAPNPAALRWHKAQEHAYNHKVISCSPIAERADVYCLQVEEHHNFALAAGVFVHNCGMAAVKLSGARAEHLPDSLAQIRSEIEHTVPAGFNSHADWSSGRADDLTRRLVPWLKEKHPKITERRKNPVEEIIGSQFGTLGGGNHFIELCIDENQDLWLMLHSGSRGIGNAIGQYFIAQAREEMQRLDIKLPDRDLAYFTEGTTGFDDYTTAVGWAQDYAHANRQEMLRRILIVLHRHLPAFRPRDEAVQCHHNYVSLEVHFGETVWVTRKGAVRALEGELGIIPGSMGARSYIVRGKGNPESFCSCSHGAGRIMSRGEAKRTFTLADHELATAGVECRKDLGVLDETPGAYKNIDSVMAAQSDLVDIVHTLKQVLCIKG